MNKRACPAEVHVMDTSIAGDELADVALPRRIRMLTALLAACDPCGHVDAGESPEVYAGAALTALRILRSGCESSDILTALPPGAQASAAVAFARSASDWWRTDSHISQSSPRGELVVAA